MLSEVSSAIVPVTSYCRDSSSKCLCCPCFSLKVNFRMAQGAISDDMHTEPVKPESVLLIIRHEDAEGCPTTLFACKGVRTEL